MSFRGWGWDKAGWRLDPWAGRTPAGTFEEGAAWGHLRSLEAGAGSRPVEEWCSLRGAAWGSPLEAFRHAPPDVKNVARQRLLRLKSPLQQPLFRWKTSIWWEPFQEHEEERREAWDMPEVPVEIRPLVLPHPRSLPPQVFKGLWLGHIYEALEFPAACPRFAKLRSGLARPLHGGRKGSSAWFRLFTPRLTVRFSLMPNDEEGAVPRGDNRWWGPEAWGSPLDLALPWLGAEYLALRREGVQKYDAFQHLLLEEGGERRPASSPFYWEVWGPRISTLLRGPLLQTNQSPDGHQWSSVWEPLSSADLQSKILGQDPPPSPVDTFGLSPHQAVFLRHLLRAESEVGVVREGGGDDPTDEDDDEV
jgi:hypothetical protein